MPEHCLPAGPRLQLEALEQELDELYEELMALSAEIEALRAGTDAEL